MEDGKKQNLQQPGLIERRWKLANSLSEHFDLVLERVLLSLESLLVDTLDSDDGTSGVLALCEKDLKSRRIQIRFNCPT